MSRGRAARAFLAFATVVSSVLLAPSGASASVAAPCTAQLAGIDITADHDTAGAAVHVDYRSEVAYTGEATDGSEVTGIAVTLEILGFGINAHGGSTSGSTWSDEVSIKKYAWAGIGLYLVKGTASSDSGPLCSGSAYMCVEGKSFFLTAAGALATILALLSLIWLIRGLLFRRRRTRVGLAYRFGGAGLLGGAALPIFLQQSCVLPLTRNLALGSVGGGLLVMAIIGALLAGPGRRAAPAPPVPAPPVPTSPVPDSEVQRQTHTVYRFVPPPGSCNACRSHAQHRTYRTAEAIAADRAHTGCHCDTAPKPVDDAWYVAHFGGVADVFDDRGG